MPALGYKISKYKFRRKGSKTINHETIKWYAIHDYYSVSQYGYTVSDKIEKVRRIVYNFKDGRNCEYYSKVFSKALRKKRFGSKEKLNDVCILVIPASNQNKTKLRYKRFCELLSLELGVKNCYKAIKTEPHEPTKGNTSGNKIKHFRFNESLYSGMDVFLIDDVMTTGTSFKQTAKALIDTGAKSVRGFFLAKTVYGIRY